MINKKVMLFLCGIVVNIVNVEAMNNDAGHSAADARERASKNCRSLAIEITNNADAFDRGMKQLFQTRSGMSAENAVKSLSDYQFTYFFTFLSSRIGKGDQSRETVRLLLDPTFASPLRDIFIERAQTYDQERATAEEYRLA
jgi:hypothetical protein